MIYFKKHEFKSVDNIYDSYNAKEFRSPFRSTIPLLVMIKNNQIPVELAKQYNCNEKPRLILEYETPVAKGKGLPSCTDLMIEYQDSCIAIESKRTEGRYESVSHWLDDSQNKKNVLTGWLSIINSHIDSAVNFDDILHLPYQLIHRVASACSLWKTETHILHLGFDLNKVKEDYYTECLSEFARILKYKVNLHLHLYSILKSGRQLSLELEWNKGKRDLSESIKGGLVKNNLMSLKIIKKKNFRE